MVFALEQANHGMKIWAKINFSFFKLQVLSVSTMKKVTKIQFHSTYEGVGTLWYIHTEEYYLTLKRCEILTYDATSEL